MDKIKTVKIKNSDGSVSEETYTISVDAKDVDMANGKELQETIGIIDIDIDGNIAEQLENLNNNVDELNIDIKKKAYFFDTVADMKNAKLKAGDIVATLGYYEPNDGGAATYKIIDEKNQDEYQEKLENGLYATLIIDETINVKQFGAKGNDINDDTNNIQKAINYAFDNEINEVYIPYGIYNISKPIFLYEKMKLFGDNCNSSIIHKSTDTKSGVSGYDVDSIIILTNRELNSNNQSQQQAIDGLQLVGNCPTYVANKQNKQYAIYSKVYSPKIKITNFLINHVDYGIFTPSMYTGIIQNCTYLEAHYGAISIYQESQGVNISNINTGAAHEFGIKLAGGSYSTLSNILIEWNYGCTCFDLTNWRGNLINCGAELGNPGFDTAIKLTNSRVTLCGAYLNSNRDNNNLVMFKLDNSTLKIENSSFGHSSVTNDYVGVFANISNHSSLVIGKGCNTPSTFAGGITRSGDNNNITINDTKLNLMSNNQVASIAGPSNKYEGQYIENLNSKLLNTNIKANGIYNGFVSSPTNNGASLEYYGSFNKGDLGIIDNASITGCAMWLCNKNNASSEEPKTIGTISNISGTTMILTDCKIENYTKNGYRIFPNCTIKGEISGATKIVSWVNYSTNTINFSNSTGLDQFQVGEKLKIVSTQFVRNGDYLYIPIINYGYTSQRPSQNIVNGVMFFDQSLGKPIWYHNGKWVDATGNQV